MSGPRAVVPESHRDQSLSRPRGAHRRQRRLDAWPRWLGTLVASMTYLGLAAFYFRRLLGSGFASSSMCGGCYDSGQQEWFVGVPGHLIAQGHSPFFTTLLNFPKGVNLLQSSIAELPGLLVEPILQWVGPIGAFNAEMILCVLGSAGAAYLALGRFAWWPPARILGGALFGFSPFIIHQNIHIFLAFSLATPLAAIVLDELLHRRQWNPYLLGGSGAAVLFLCYFTSAEMFVDLIIITGIASFFYVVSNRRSTLVDGAYYLKALLTTIGLSVVALAYPIYIQVLGRQHYVGAPQSNLSSISSDLLSPYIPTYFEWFGTHAMKVYSGTFVRGIPAEDSLYLGVPLVLLLVVTFRRRTWWVTASLISAALLSFGPRLHVAGHATSIPMPELLVAHLPLLSALTPSRFSVFVFFFAAVQVAMWLDSLRRNSDRGVSARLGLWVAIICLLPLIPIPLSTAKQTVPRFFLNQPTATIPAGSAIVAYPFPSFVHEDAMIWQASSHYSFSMPGGYIYAPNAVGAATLFPGASTAIGQELNRIYAGMPASYSHHNLQAVRAEITSWGIRYFVSGVNEPHAATASHFISVVLHERPRAIGGVDVWQVPR